VPKQILILIDPEQGGFDTALIGLIGNAPKTAWREGFPLNPERMSTPGAYVSVELSDAGGKGDPTLIPTQTQRYTRGTRLVLAERGLSEFITISSSSGAMCFHFADAEGEGLKGGEIGMDVDEDDRFCDVADWAIAEWVRRFDGNPLDIVRNVTTDDTLRAIIIAVGDNVPNSAESMARTHLGRGSLARLASMHGGKQDFPRSQVEGWWSDAPAFAAWETEAVDLAELERIAELAASLVNELPNNWADDAVGGRLEMSAHIEVDDLEELISLTDARNTSPKITIGYEGGGVHLDAAQPRDTPAIVIDEESERRHAGR